MLILAHTIDLASFCVELSLGHKLDVPGYAAVGVALGKHYFFVPEG